MPFDVRMPDGTLITNVPDGTTQEDILARFQASQTAPTETAPQTGMSPEFSRALQTARDVQGMPATTQQYLTNAARLAPVSGVSSTYGLVRGVMDLAGIDPTTSPTEKIMNIFSKPVQVNPLDNPLLRITGASQVIQNQEIPATGQILTQAAPYIQDTKTQLGSLTGARTDLVPPDLTTKVLGTAIETGLDPTVLMTGGFPQRISQLPSVMARRAPGAATVGGAAEIGGELGANIEQAITGEDTGAGRAIAGIATGGTVAAKGTAVKEGIETGFNAAKQVYNKYKTIKADPAAAEEAMAVGAAKRFLQKVAEGTPIDKIDTLIDDFTEISSKIVNRGLPEDQQGFPLAIAMAEDPTVRAAVTQLAKSNPQFRTQLESEISRIAQAIDKNADTIFGKRYVPIGNVEQVSVKNAANVRAKVDQQLDDIANRFSDPEQRLQMGEQITQLVDARRKAAIAEQSAEYNALAADAKKAGAQLPEAGVRDIYNFVVTNNMRDIFGKGTALDSAIMKFFAPQNGEFFPASFDNIMSLKAEINRLQRGRLEPREARLLGELENVVNQAREAIPGNFNQRLKDIDQAYYERVGVPFGSQGIKDIDAKKYAEQVAPVVVKSVSQFNQFKNAVGADNANVIGRNAVLAEIYDKAIKPTGEFNPNILRAYMKKNAAVIDEIPGLKQELNMALADDSILKRHRETLDNNVKVAEQRLADNFITKAIDPSTGTSLPSYGQLMTRMLGGRDGLLYVQNSLKDVDPATSKAVRNSLKAEFINKARENPDGGIAFLNDVKNKEVVEFLFGKGTQKGMEGFNYNTYKQAVNDLLKLSDAVKKADVAKISIQVNQKDLDAFGRFLQEMGLPGLDTPYIASTLRDRISSTFQKGVRLLSRVNQSRVADETEQQLMKLLLDPQGLKKLQNMTKEIDLNFKNPASVRRFVDTMTDIFPRYMFATGMAVTNEPPPEPPLDIQMLETE